MADIPETACALSPEALLDHWQGHRRLTRRTLDAFPDDKLFTYALGGMRPFGAMANEFLSMTIAIANGVATGTWAEHKAAKPDSKAEVLRQWDEQTGQLDTIFRNIPPHRFAEVDTAFGQWTMPGFAMILYGIDNEIHHRAQGYVYLRTLGIEPPPFWERQ